MNGSIKANLGDIVTEAVKSALGVVEDPGITETGDPRFGDYQTNVAIRLSRASSQNPRDVAKRVVRFMDTRGICRPEIAGPGFINFHLDHAWLGSLLGKRVADPRLGVQATSEPKRIVIDFSSPNVAKRMHAGHLRSTIIGDTIIRVFRYLGHQVLGDNHVGDWGTQFGLLIYGFKTLRNHADYAKDPIGELERIYQVMTGLCDRDTAAATACKEELVKLQSGEPENLALWKEFVAVSRVEAEKIYRRLGVTFDLWRGESYYASMLPSVVRDLRDGGIASQSNGAVVVLFPHHRDLADSPFLILKSNGGYLYSTTDIATVRSRIEELHADKIVYIVDSRQSLHFKQLFATAEMMGYRADLIHVGFGMMMGPDGRPFRTRDGKTVPLEKLLDEGESHIKPLVQRKWPDISGDETREICARVAVGAIKYADLSHHLASDYRFEWDRFLNPDGNTGPYLQYTLVRANSVLRIFAERNGETFAPDGSAERLDTAEEVMLAKKLLAFPDVVYRVGETLLPHFLCEYLYALARAYNLFYSLHPIILAEDAVIRRSRLALTWATSAAMQIGLACLNIPRVERM